MSGHGVNKNTFFQMHDAHLIRCLDRQARLPHREAAPAALATPALVGRLASLLRLGVVEFSRAWETAARRRGAVRVLRRMDRRALADLGIERARIREVVDGVAAPQTAARDAGSGGVLGSLYALLDPHFRVSRRA